MMFLMERVSVSDMVLFLVEYEDDMTHPWIDKVSSKHSLSSNNNDDDELMFSLLLCSWEKSNCK